MGQDNITQEQIKFILKHCFEYKAKELAFELAPSLVDNEGYEIIKKAESICYYVDVKKVTDKIRKECFDKYYKYNNLNNQFIKDYILAGLKEFDHFGWGYRDCPGWVNGMWGPTFNNNPVGAFTWKMETGKEAYKWFPYNLSETLIYHNGYNEATKELNRNGFNPEYGSSVASYIERNIIYFKPYASAAVEYLKRQTK